ncbi:protease inhibitor I42 family protein [Chloroflexota bacterium]
MRLKLVLTCGIVILALSVLGCSQQAGLEYMKDATVERTCEGFRQNPHDRGDVVLGVDGTLIVILCSNPTTGFQWMELPQISDTSVLRQESHEFTSLGGNGTVGASGKDVWTFRTLKKGTSSISFEYSRSWEGGEKGEWAFDLEVQVRE